MAIYTELKLLKYNFQKIMIQPSSGSEALSFGELFLSFSLTKDWSDAFSLSLFDTFPSSSSSLELLEFDDGLLETYKSVIKLAFTL